MLYYITPNTAYAVASNIKDGENPPYTIADFRAAMPGFTADIISDAQLGFYVNLAHAVV